MENQDFKKDLQEIFKFFEKTEPDLYLQKKIINLQAKLTQEIDDLSDRDTCQAVQSGNRSWGRSAIEKVTFCFKPRSLFFRG